MLLLPYVVHCCGNEYIGPTISLISPLSLLTLFMLNQPHDSTVESNARFAADALISIVKEEGVLGLYRGLVPALLLTSHGMVQVRRWCLVNRFWFLLQVRGSGRQPFMCLQRITAATATMYPLHCILLPSISITVRGIRGAEASLRIVANTHYAPFCLPGPVVIVVVVP